MPCFEQGKATNGNYIFSVENQEKSLLARHQHLLLLGKVLRQDIIFTLTFVTLTFERQNTSVSEWVINQPPILDYLIVLQPFQFQGQER